MQREAQQAMIPPSTYFLADINQRRGLLHTIFENPHPSTSLPNIGASAGCLWIRLEHQANGFVPGSWNQLFSEPRRQVRRCPPGMTACGQEQDHRAQGPHSVKSSLEKRDVRNSGTISKCFHRGEWICLINAHLDAKYQ